MDHNQYTTIFALYNSDILMSVKLTSMQREMHMFLACVVTVCACVDFRTTDR